MSEPNLGNLVVHSSGRVLGNGTLQNAVNVSAAVRNGLGSYTITLGTPIDPTTRFIALTIVANGGSPAATIILDTSTLTDDTHFSVSELDTAGAAQDSIFDFMVFRTSVPA